MGVVHTFFKCVCVGVCACVRVRQLEELMGTLERTRQELDATKQRLSSTQQSLQERDGHLSSMRTERRTQLEEILEMKSVISTGNAYWEHILGNTALAVGAPCLVERPNSTTHGPWLASGGHCLV